MDEHIISADSHVNPIETMWKDYLPASFRDQAPRIEPGPEGDMVVFEDTRRPFLMLINLAGRKKEDYKATGKITEMPAGGYDPVKRIEAQDIDGVEAEVLYADAAGRAGTVMLSKNQELRIAGCEAYNNWLVDFCSYAPDRLIGLGTLPMDDPERAVKELHRIRGKDIRGVQIAAHAPAHRGDYGQPEWEPVWAAAEETGMVLNIHLGAWNSQWAWPNHQGPADDYHILANAPMNKMAVCVPIATFVMAGVFQRHPKLRLVSGESGTGWFPFLADYMDHFWNNHKYWTHSPLTEPPSFYLRRNVKGTYIEDKTALVMRDVIGVENIMWSSDYPHSETLWPESRRHIEESFGDIPAEDRRRIVYENVAELYDIRVPALA